MTQHNVHHAFVIEVAGETAGIIVREERGVRFHSSGPRFDRHDAICSRTCGRPSGRCARRAGFADRAGGLTEGPGRPSSGGPRRA